MSSQGGEGAEREQSAATPLLSPDPSLWVLLDDRAGNNAQSRGLAEAMGIPKELVQIQYNWQGKLPNILRGASLRGVDAEYIAAVSPPFPHWVVAAGRKLAPVACFIKQHSPKTKLIHIMRPEMPLDAFEHIILPEHDAASAELEASGKLLQSVGALCHIAEEDLQREAHSWAPHLTHVPAPRAALLVGGSSKGGKMTVTHVQALLQEVIAHMQESGMQSLLVSTSRRTPPDCIAALKEGLEGIPHHFHAYQPTGANPYLAYLALADWVVVTGESVSMCSEAAFTGKPVYVYEHNAMAPKHRAYVASLYDRGVARPLQDFSADWQGGAALRESARIAAEILA